MARTGRSSCTSTGYHLRPSSGKLCDRPRWNSPPGMNTIPRSPAIADPTSSTLSVKFRNLIGGNVPVRAQRIDIGVNAAGRRIPDLLRPVDAERRVHRGHHVLGARLLFVVPAGLEALLTLGVGAPENVSTVDPGACEQSRVAAI